MMVVSLDPKRVLLILQIDHTRIAGMLAAHWGNEQFAEPTPYTSMVVAAAEHDSGWWEWEIKPTLGAGNLPGDYITSIEDLGGLWHDFYAHAVERLAAKDPYAAWIVSKHGEGLISQGFGLLPRIPNYLDLPGAAEFVTQQHAVRERLLEQMRTDPATAPYSDDDSLWRNYRLMEIYDQLAQFVCNRFPLNNETPRPGPPDRIKNAPRAPGVDDTMLHVEPINEHDARITPWPFDVERLELKFPARIVARRPFVDREDFLRTFYKADRLLIEYALVR